MSPTFSTGKLRRMFHHISTGAQALVEHLKEKKAQGQAVELKHVVSCFTMDVIASTGFSVQINSFKVSSDQRIFQDPSENLVVRSLNSKTYRLSNLLDKSAKLCMNDIYGIYFKSVRGAHENTAYFIFYEFLKNHFDHNEKFLGWVYIKSSPDGSELPCF